MIKAVTVINHRKESLRMDLGRPEKSGFLIKDITGLGPGTASVDITESAAMDGGGYNSARLPSRNIVFYIKYLWNPTIESSRKKAYIYFPIKKAVTLIFETESGEYLINGYIETHEPKIFSSDCDLQVSIMCPDRYFYLYNNNDGC